MAVDGMYYKEFPVMFDWFHNGEGFSAFFLQGLSDPDDPQFQRRSRRFAGFYMDEDPQAKNYDPERKLIRSMFNGSRGPLLRKATGLDWAGDPIEIEGALPAGARRARLRRDGGALQGLQRRGRRSPDQPGLDHPTLERLYARPRREIPAVAGRLCQCMGRAHPGNGRYHPHQCRPRRSHRRRVRRPLVRWRLRLGLHRDRAPDRRVGPIAPTSTRAPFTALATRCCSPAISVTWTRGAA